jgi:hypothetical protein
MKKLFCALAFPFWAFVAVAAPPASSVPFNQNIISGTNTVNTSVSSSLVGPCDILAAAGQICEAAYSMDRRMYGAYTGPLFQLIRASDSTTLNVTSTSTGIYNLLAQVAFCNLTTCAVQEVYDQSGNGNNLIQSSSSAQSAWALYYTNGLPYIFANHQPASYNLRTGTTGIPTGAANVTLYTVFGADLNSSCCGTFGWMENNPASIAAGQMWAQAYSSNTQSGANVTFTGVGLSLDIEGGVAGGTQAVVPNVTGYIAKYASASNVGTQEYFDATLGQLNTIESWTLPQAPALQNGIGLGNGGDNTPAAAEFFEGAMISGTTSAATDALLAANATAFFKNQQIAYQGPVDSVSNRGFTCDNNNWKFTCSVSPFTGGAWGLRRLVDGYTGPVATLQRADNNSLYNIGTVSNGDFDDASALADCAGTTCGVERLYGQIVPSQQNSTLGSIYDFVQPTRANQPTIAFNALNSKTVMVGNGTSDIMCTNGTPPSLGPGWTIAAVAERTGNYGNIAAIAQYETYGDMLGYTPSGGGSNLTRYNSASVLLTATAVNATWNFIQGSSISYNYAPTTGGSSSVNNGTLSTSSSTTNYAASTPLCIFGNGPYGSVTNYLTGDIAEVYISNPSLTPAQLTNLYQNAHNYYGGQF